MTGPSKRFTALLGASWYILSAIQAPWLALELAAPPVEARGTGEFPCSGHGCGCDTIEECRDRCCCLKKARPAPEEAGCHGSSDEEAAPRIEARLVAGCSGGPPADAMGPLPLAPHLSPARAPLPAGSHRGAALATASGRLDQAFADPPLKVPIRSSSVSSRS